MKKMVIALLATIGSAVSLPAGAVELLTNGDFETGTLAGWTTTAVSGSWSSGFFTSTPGTATPVSGYPTAPNPAGGTTYAVTDQSGPGTYALIQSFVVPVGATTVTLSFDMFANNQSGGGVFVDPIGLDHTTGNPNQHARVDILTSTSSAFSTLATDVVANLYLGADSTPPNPYTNYVIDLSGLVTPGMSYQLRFAEVDNQLFFNQGVDNVSLQAAVVPEPPVLALMSVALLGMAFRRNRKRN